MLCHGELAARRREPRRPRDPDTPESRPGGGKEHCWYIRGGRKEHLPLSGSPRLGVRAAPKEALPYHTTLARVCISIPFSSLSLEILW